MTNHCNGGKYPLMQSCGDKISDCWVKEELSFEDKYGTLRFTGVTWNRQHVLLAVHRCNINSVLPMKNNFRDLKNYIYTSGNFSEWVFSLFLVDEIYHTGPL